MSESSIPSPGGPGSPQAAPPQAPPPPPPWWVPPKRRRSWARRLLVGVVVVVFVASLVMNLYLLFLLSLFIDRGLDTTVVKPGRSDEVVAVWEINGLILQQQAALMEEFCRQVRADPKVRAVVLRVNSGGGMVSPCDQMYQMLKDLKTSGKKVVVSMGGVAASGGYYVSLPGDTIYAEPTTITGSIGVLMVLPVFKGTMDKYGLKMLVVRSKRTEAWKAAPNPFEEPAGYQIDGVRRTLDAMQEQFESVVRDERGDKLTVKEAVKTYTGADGKEFTVEEAEPFNGKEFLAEEARQLGLVDQVGYLRDAISEAGRIAGLSNPKVVRYTRRKGMLEGMLTHVGLGRSVLPVNLRLLEEIATPRVLMVWRIPQ